MMKNAFYFMLKALLVLEIFGYVEKRLDKNIMSNFKIYNVTDWTSNNDNAYIAQYLKK